MAQEDEVHFVGQVTQKALIEHEGKILLVQYPEGDPAAGKWDMPGGRLNEGESAIEGLRREVREEIGAEIEIQEILATGINVVDEHFKLFFVIYRAKLVHPAQKLVRQEDELATLEWRDKEDFFTLPIINPSFQEALKPFLV